MVVRSVKSTTGRRPGESNKRDAISMDRLIAEAARALALGDALGALKRVALRDDPDALALRGIAMAQLGDLERGRALLHRASRAFGPALPQASARCDLAAAEIALVTRDLGGLSNDLPRARKCLAAFGDRQNATQAGYLQARLALLLGHLDKAQQVLASVDLAELPAVSRPGYFLVAAGIAMRRIEPEKARQTLKHAAKAAADLAIPALTAEVEAAQSAFAAPVMRLITGGAERPITLTEVGRLLASDRLIVDACRNQVRQASILVSLTGRPVLFGLARVMAGAWPQDVSREDLLAHVFRARHCDDSHRARLRVEIGRLRKAIAPFAAVEATHAGYMIKPHSGHPAVLLPPIEGPSGKLLALLADGEVWSSSGLALALDVSVRTVQRALETLHQSGKIEAFRQGRARRWIIAHVPGFPTGLSLSAILPGTEGKE